ncbi:MAG: RNA-binding protein [Paracoccaceae bacterium]|nr:RNA-binding protein [Paracoccaceae bacterium]MDE3121337.1 RNA-binding protein [Paracoccaceae bacterium]MDE3238116.1 RNA-binding protein [Paracoccaceae bacterium]
MTRGGAVTDTDNPERRCIVTGDVGPKARLIRFVVGPDGQVVADILGRLPGRGIWVSADRATIEKAARKGLFSRAAKRPVTVPEGLADAVEAAQARRVVDLLSLARKAGDAVVGYEKVKDWLAKGRAVVLVQASDGSERGKSKLHPPGGKDSFVGCLTSREMGLAFAREHAIHGALAAGGLATRVVEEAAKLAGLRERIGGPAAGKDTKDA